MASDAELIGRSLSGDAEAFMEVICRHEVAIGAYLERRVEREAAEDLLGMCGPRPSNTGGRMIGRSPGRGRGCTRWR